jgi:hypothetical protein
VYTRALNANKYSETRRPDIQTMQWNNMQDEIDGTKASLTSSYDLDNEQYVRFVYQ